MKKEYIIIIILSLLVIGLGGFIVYDKIFLDKNEVVTDNSYKDDIIDADNQNKENDINNDHNKDHNNVGLEDEENVDNTSEYTFDTAYGNIKIKADNALACRGSAGASNIIFYIKDNNLYLYVHNNEDELYVENVDNMYYESDMVEQITVELMDSAIIKNESTYLKYVK